MRLVGRQHQRLLEALQRLGVAAEVVQQRSAVDPVLRRRGVERQRLVEALQRLLGEAGLGGEVGAVAVRLGEIGVEGDGRVVGAGGLGELVEALVRLAHQVVQPCLRLAQRQRPLGQVDALLELVLLAGHQGHVIERLGVLGVVAQ
ncbi:MAG TPA: hypothetical protein VE224_05065, partial [Pseudolabrys sp.]|nr:hypothetical protein [Pseudolabrys sp.]